VIGVSIRTFKKLNLPLVEYILKEKKRHIDEDKALKQCYLFSEDEDTKRIRFSILEKFNNLNLGLKFINLPSNSLRKKDAIKIQQFIVSPYIPTQITILTVL